MTRFKKITLIIILSLVTISLNFSLAGAAIPAPADRLKNVGKQAGFEQAKGLPETVGGIIRTFLTILGVIFMIYIVHAGYLWMIARGEEEKIIKAKAIIRGSIVGLLIILAAYAITAFVVNRFTVAIGYNPPAETTDG